MAGRGRSTPQRGEITGYLLKLIRESILLTQEQLAVELGVDRATVQSWESGRRPFTAVPFGQAIATRQRLGRLGANTPLLAALDDAAEADFILTAILDNQVERTDVAEQPLGWSVLTHRLTDMILWAVLGQPPTFVRSLSRPQRRRGPVTAGPILPIGQRRAFFAHLHVLAERSTVGRHPNVLLHRQSCFLAGMDPNYSAYWVGEIPYRQRDDSFMAAVHPDWRGSLLLRHLVERLEAGHPFVDLNIHNVWALLTARRGLALDDPGTGQALGSGRL